MSDTGIGAAVRRKEDQRFLTGRGTYVDDMNRPGQSYAAFVRSPHAHAEIKSVDTKAAEAADGVIAVLTGADVAADGLGGLPCGWGITSKDGNPMAEPAWPILASGKVRYVGNMVAVVIAGTVDQARDAAAMIEVDYAVLAAVVATDGSDAGNGLVHEEAAGNVCFDWELGDKDGTDAAIASAAHVATLELLNNRLVPHAMEPRSAVADYEPGTDQLTLYCTSQGVHVQRLLLGAFVLQHPEHRFRVVTPDVGGGFGSKIYPYAEYAVLCWAAKRLGQAVKWTSDRSEAFLTDAHGRDHVTKVELALDTDGKFTGLRVATSANLGGYLSAFAPLVPTFLYATLFAGQYTTPVIYANVIARFTNTTPVDALRGAGRPEATYLLERIIEEAARETGRDPVELRRINLVPSDAFPYQTPVALCYDSGDYEATLNKATDLADYAGFGARRDEAKSRNKLRGIGISTPIEATGAAPSNIAGQLGARAGLYESATVRFNATGNVSLIIGSQSSGQGHETAFAQLVSDKLGVDIDSVDVVEGDSARSQMGMGTFASRSLSVGGSAVDKAMDKIIDKGRKIAAHLLEASVDDIEFAGGDFTVSGTDRSVNIGAVAFAAYVPHNYPLEELEPGLEEQAFFDPANFNFPYGAYICEVEIDPDTGATEVVKFTAVDDVGTIINPMLLDGQVHGGLAQGIGQAVLENVVYDSDGQMLSGSLMDYTMPRADNLPSFNTDTTVTPCPLNPLGVKGVGEIGAIGSPPAVINAIVNALSPLGVKTIEMPATSQAVWQAIQQAQA
jgi:aerobic carbon-monoxide dehydrogenase large subunit